MNYATVTFRDDVRKFGALCAHAGDMLDGWNHGIRGHAQPIAPSPHPFIALVPISLRLGRFAILGIVVVGLLLGKPAWCQTGILPPAVFIRIEDGRLPEVVLLERAPSPGTFSGKGLLVWSDAGREQWRVVPEPQRKAGSPGALAMASRFTSISRGEQPVPAGDAASVATVQIDQLLGQLAIRGAGLLTPPNFGRCLQPQITIRRLPANRKPHFPADELVLRQGNREILRVRMNEGQAAIRWSEIPGLPQQYRDGLPAGEYTLRAESGGESTTFTVEDDEIRAWVLELPDELAGLVGSKADPLYLLVAVEHLLAQLDENGRPQPYLADALDLVEANAMDVARSVGAEADGTRSVPATLGYFKGLREGIVARLSGSPVPKQAAERDGATGIAAVDRARQLIEEGKWKKARETLDSPELADSPRAAALASLYRAVILAESGPGADEEARALFRRAIEELENEPADAYRARVNYASFLLGRAQDRLYNHAFEIASGVANPLIHALVNWRESLDSYEKALELAGSLGPAEAAAVQVNRARLYRLLADVIRTLDPPRAGGRNFAAGERSAAERARELAESVAEKSGVQIEAMVLAVALETLAQLDYRAGDTRSCCRHANRAMELYLAAGSVAGAEGLHRLLGLAELQGSGQPSAEARKRALDHLLVAQLLAEVLRDRIPADQAGLTRAGFFARRAYVHERILELLLAEGRAAEALRYAELAKARALEDVLSIGAPGAAAGSNGRRELSEILADWPDEVAAVEYFLGTERAWAMVVDTSGQVSAHSLADAHGQAVASRELVERVGQFLSGMGHQADKMRPRLTAGRGFDHGWQDTLQQFCLELLPGPVLGQLRKAKTVLIVPHHILHYFPFVALVTERDRRRLSQEQMAMPKFVLDEPFVVCYAPSLTAWDLLRRQPDAPIRQVQAAGIVEFLDAPSLPGARKDIENLQAVFGPRIHKLLPGRDAFETDARKLFDERGLLFVATHGLNQAEKPLASFLLFHPDRKNDGYLTAGELYAGHVAADLVVMSACYSGLADRSPLPGDDLFGLQRALLHSGARTVVAGVWDVYDGTGPELMNGFFHELASGKPTPQALADSQRVFLNRLRQSDQVEPWLHPYFWAVYTATGDDRTRVLAEE